MKYKHLIVAFAVVMLLATPAGTAANFTTKTAALVGIRG